MSIGNDFLPGEVWEALLHLFGLNYFILDAANGGRMRILEQHFDNSIFFDNLKKGNFKMLV